MLVGPSSLCPSSACFSAVLRGKLGQNWLCPSVVQAVLHGLGTVWGCRDRMACVGEVRSDAVRTGPGWSTRQGCGVF